VNITDLPAVNASLNFVSTIFISAGWYFIRRNFWQRHIACMIVAVVSSSAFLTCYLIYHYYTGDALLISAPAARLRPSISRC